MEDLLEEIQEVTTKRTRWWVVVLEDGFYGENIDEEGDKGFDLKLFSTQEAAERAAVAFLEGDDFPYEVVEINFSEVQ